MIAGVLPDNALDDGFRPGAGRIDQHAGTHLPLRGAVAQCDHPAAGLAARADNARARHDGGAVPHRIAGVQDDKARILDPAIGIFEGPAKFRLQRGAGRIRAKIQCLRSRQQFAAAKMVIEEQPQPDQPGRPAPLQPGHDGGDETRYRGAAFKPHSGGIGQDKAHRPRDMRHRTEQGFAFDQRLADKSELKKFQIAQTAMKQLCRGRGGCRSEIIHLGQSDPHPAPGRVAGDAAAIHPAADDEQIEFPGGVIISHLQRTLWGDNAGLSLPCRMQETARRRGVGYKMVYLGDVTDPHRRIDIEFRGIRNKDFPA